ncbi:hypothetical protein RHMOL_Rhmol05G0171600 [Rhododendron molle]|uniref:Uncharacterized protein n=1 Tax=Rhododendron molle TaxID=49168 RepID=A0ACC0NPV3_RHOML|nr:hypothetical protein RHMOL_Rhmol05G0171600 [Rhododendron molle]
MGIVICDGPSNDIRMANEKEKSRGKCKGKKKVTSNSRGKKLSFKWYDSTTLFSLFLKTMLFE